MYDCHSSFAPHVTHTMRKTPIFRKEHLIFHQQQKHQQKQQQLQQQKKTQFSQPKKVTPVRHIINRERVCRRLNDQFHFATDYQTSVPTQTLSAECARSEQAFLNCPYFFSDVQVQHALHHQYQQQHYSQQQHQHIQLLELVAETRRREEMLRNPLQLDGVEVNGSYH